MGCVTSKRVEASVAANVYRPPPTSIALFDISTIEEPWLITTTTTKAFDDDEREQKEKEKKLTAVPLPLLEKLESYEVAPKSWSEVSKVLEDLKPTLNSEPPPAAAKPHHAPPPPDPKKPPSAPSKNNSFHTLEELESHTKKPSPRPSSPPRASSPARPQPPEMAGFRSVKENSFIVRDREERQRQKAGGDVAAKLPWWRRDPLDGYPERCPPGNADGVVLYTTTLRGVRRTFEDCEQARRVLEGQALDFGVAVDERDVSLHGEFLREVRELVGEELAVPRLFIRGRYVGGVDEVVELSETGKLREMLRWVARRVGDGSGKGGKKDCECCGGARFIPCMECNGSCKVVGEDGKSVERCEECNENGLMLCPLCH
ncbi:unnamed protein product [Musa acuminata subsp. malaccensis]|uniref:(wild Malaysian banana) hypothetical protein n=1 Tax=Musa acuminata subsp. malaccensis TaxID=214687 RepID=A0A804KWE5_MUSAM|nr:PREDICTED: glutaredoxin domain-containing cysteine-rich protein CG12206 [Musa acuminata subsp. malaccensis]CAG1853584.1 unnamed protein product [Musa acuminata subsp. malaccensis]